MRGALFFLFVFSSLGAIEYQPWFGPEKLVEIRNHVTYRHTPKVQAGTGRVRYYSNDFLGTSSASLVPTTAYSIEAEISTAETNQRTWGVNDAKIAGRYLFWDDITGDPISLSFGAVIGRASHIAIHDISTFHHGKWEYEGHAAFGKEWSCEEFWTKHLWGFVAMGIASEGSPWMRGEFYFERNYWDLYGWSVFAKSLFGLGDRPLTFPQSPISSFTGYGSVCHRSVDVGGKLSYTTCNGVLEAEYSYRPYARNYPTHSHALTISYTMTFPPTIIPGAVFIARYLPSPLD